MTMNLPGIGADPAPDNAMRLIPAEGVPGGSRIRDLPDPTVTGPCQVQATFMCTNEAAGEHLIPQSMLPDSLIKGPLYAPMCLPCKEHLSDAYVTELHRGKQS